MPGQVQHTVDSLVAEAKRLVSLGVPGLILFGVPEHKDAQGSGAWDPDGIVQVALRTLRAAIGDELVLMADLCLDEYTDHGHCGVLGPAGEVHNDATLELYQRVALAQADAGADVVAPSGMMDGQVAAIRAALDGAGHDQVAILAYAAKYASALYGPFRDAVDVTIAGGGDRRGLPAGPAQPPRGAGRDRTGRGRGRRHGHGQAGPDVARRVGRWPGGRCRRARWRPTTSVASTPWSRRPRPPAGSTGRPWPSSS